MLGFEGRPVGTFASLRFPRAGMALDLLSVASQLARHLSNIDADYVQHGCIFRALQVYAKYDSVVR